MLLHAITCYYRLLPWLLIASSHEQPQLAYAAQCCAKMGGILGIKPTDPNVAMTQPKQSAEGTAFGHGEHRARCFDSLPKSFRVQHAFSPYQIGTKWKYRGGRTVAPLRKQHTVLSIFLRIYGGFQKWGTPKSSILVEFSITHQPFWGSPIYGTPPYIYI